jgi:glycosyltransferase involved in cell wall biosynthesis
MRCADVVVQFNISLKGILPVFFSLRPLVVSHQGVNQDENGKWMPFGRLKQFIADHFVQLNIACSHYVASFTRGSVVIHNSYNSTLFRQIPSVERTNNIVFVGRLVSDKGCDILLKAFARFKRNDITDCYLTIVGDGPERTNLERLAIEEGISLLVRFEGKKFGDRLVEILNRHAIMVVPSVWEEPFGIVALEGLACGCNVLVSRAGGLPEAVGAVGATFIKGDIKSLTEMLSTVSRQPRAFNNDILQKHLQDFTIEETVRKLLSHLRKIE